MIKTNVVKVEFIDPIWRSERDDPARRNLEQDIIVTT